jgi:hypothetical protein
MEEYLRWLDNKMRGEGGRLSGAFAYRVKQSRSNGHTVRVRG